MKNIENTNNVGNTTLGQNIRNIRKERQTTWAESDCFVSVCNRKWCR